MWDSDLIWFDGDPYGSNFFHPVTVCVELVQAIGSAKTCRDQFAPVCAGQ